MEERIETIILLCCLHFDVQPQEFFSKSHTRKSAYARTSAVILMRYYTTKTVKEIAQLVKRSHPTVITNATTMSHLISKEIDLIENKFKRLAL